MYTAAERQKILSEAHTNIAAKKRERTTSSSARGFELVQKTREDALVERSAAATSAGSEHQSWQEWVSDFVYARIAEFAEDAGKQTVRWLDEIRREQKLLEREVVQLREQLAIERGLASLRDEVADARAQVPKVPELVERLETQQARFKSELEKTQKRVSRVRVDQSIAAHRLADLAKETKKQTANVEMQIEHTVASFKAEIHPEAAATLRKFATETLKGTQHEKDKIWIFEGAALSAAS